MASQDKIIRGKEKFMKFADITEAFEDAGYDVRSYSGRYMFGKKCLGVDCSHTDNVVIDTICEYTRTCESVYDIREFCELLKDSKEDNMGLGKIIYFPRIDWANIDENECDENECDEED